MTVAVFFRTVPMILVMGTIFFLSHRPGDSFDLPGIPGLDKAAHFLIYALLGATVIFACSGPSRRAKPQRAAATAVGVCLLYGLTDEFHQSFIPGRFSSGADLMMDVLGGVCISLLWLKWRKIGE